MMEGFDFQKFMEGTKGDPSKVWPQINKMMEDLKMPKLSGVEIPIIITKVTRTESDEISKLIHGDEEEHIEVEEKDSVIFVLNGEWSCIERGYTNEDVERAFITLKNGATYESSLTYKELKELLGVG